MPLLFISRTICPPEILRKLIVDVDHALLVEEVLTRANLRGEFIIIAFCNQPLRHDPPPHAIGVEEHLTAVGAE